MKKTDFSTFLSRNWVYYVVWLIVSVFIFSQLTSIAVKPKKEETVGLFICARSAGDIENALDVALDGAETRPSGIVVYNRYYTDDYYNLLFLTQGLSASEIFILPSAILDNESVVSAFTPISEVWSKEFTGGEFYTVEGVNYGVKVFDKTLCAGSAKGIVEYADDGVYDDYYMFFGTIPENKTGYVFAVAKAYYYLGRNAI